MAFTNDYKLEFNWDGSFKLCNLKEDTDKKGNSYLHGMLGVMRIEVRSFNLDSGEKKYYIRAIPGKYVKKEGNGDHQESGSSSSSGKLPF